MIKTESDVCSLLASLTYSFAYNVGFSPFIFAYVHLSVAHVWNLNQDSYRIYSLNLDYLSVCFKFDQRSERNKPNSISAV